MVSVCCGDCIPVLPSMLFSMTSQSCQEIRAFSPFHMLLLCPEHTLCWNTRRCFPYQCTKLWFLVYWYFFVLTLGEVFCNSNYPSAVYISFCSLSPVLFKVIPFPDSLLEYFLTTHDGNEKPNNLPQYIIISWNINSVLSITKENVHPTDVP